MPDLTIKLDDADRKRLESSLDPKQFQTITRTIVTRTTKQLAKLVKSGVRDRSTIKVKYVNRVIVAKGARGNPPVGVVTVSQERLPLIAFQARASKRGGVTVKISNDLTVHVTHGFIATMDSGHIGIFTRAQHLPTKGANVGKGKLTPEGFAGRFAIEERFGPSVLQIVNVPKVIDQLEFDAGEYMGQQANIEYQKFLNQQQVQEENE